MKKLITILTVMFTVAAMQPTYAQFGNFKSLKNKVSGAVKKAVNEKVDKTVEKATDSVLGNSSSSSSTTGNRQLPTQTMGTGNDNAVRTAVAIDGDVIYVSAKGSNRNDGLTPQTPLKNLQKAVDNASDNTVIKIAAGNYLGTLNQGFIEVKDKYLSLVGGYTDDFSARDPYKNVTMIRPSAANVSTNGAKALLEIDVRRDANALFLIDGIAFDLGEENLYANNNPESAINGAPEGCLTGRIQATGESLQSEGPSIGGKTMGHQLIHGVVKAHMVIRNCTFTNGGYYGIQMMNQGSRWEVYNNVFVANSYAACQIDDFTNKGGITYVDFHHNTVLFSWCRTKLMEDMGFGFRFMSRVDADVHDNIFGCSNLGALEYTHKAPEKNIEAMRKVSVVNNKFFMNTSDILLPSASYMWLYVKYEDFEEVEDLDVVQGNDELNDQNYFAKINQAYLKGFTNIKKVSEQNVDPNSAMNTFRQAMGMNIQGTETVRVSMFGNKYPFEEAFNLFGAYKGCGAQYSFE